MSAATEAIISDSAGAHHLHWEVVERRCREMGVAENDTARGQLLGVNRNTVLRWRHGHTGVSLPVAARVAQIIGVSLDQLVDANTTSPGTPPPTPPPPQPPNEPTHPPTRSEG